MRGQLHLSHHEQQVGRDGEQAGHEQGLGIARQGTGDDRDAHEGGIAETAAQGRHGRRRAVMAGQDAVGRVADPVDEELCGDDAQPELRMRKALQGGGGHDLEQQQRQGHVEDIEAQGLVGVLGQGPEKIQADAQTDEQEHGNNGGKCFDHALAYASPGRMSRSAGNELARQKSPEQHGCLPDSGHAAIRDRPCIRTAGPFLSVSGGQAPGLS